MSAKKTTTPLVWINCPDCGEEILKDSFTHELTCPVTTGRAYTSPGTAVSGDGLEVEYICYLCKAIVRQDAEEEISIDDRGNPVCSRTCRAGAISATDKTKAALTAIELATREYVRLDLEEAEHRAFYKSRSAAAQRIVELVGVGGHFQDAAGTVYEVAPVKGKWVDFTPYEVARTRRGTEPRGSLSLERAEELGYEVLRKRKASKKVPPPPRLPVLEDCFF